MATLLTTILCYSNPKPDKAYRARRSVSGAFEAAP